LLNGTLFPELFKSAQAAQAVADDKAYP